MGKRKRHSKPSPIPNPAISSVQPSPGYRAFTVKYSGITNRILTDVGITPGFDPNDYRGKKTPFEIVKKIALWDTGATGSVITAATAKELKLTAVGSALVNHVDGQSKTKTYLVNLFLPNRVAFPGVLVSECKDSDFGVIIGMDIIARGDFAITNLDSKTWMSFRVPSVQSIDYVAEFNDLRKKQ